MFGKFKELVGEEVVLTVAGKEYRGTLWNDTIFTRYYIVSHMGETVIRFNGCDVFDMTKGDKV